MEIKLRSGILRRVALTKNGDCDITFRVTGKPDPGFTKEQFHALCDLWEINENLDLTLGSASDGN